MTEKLIELALGTFLTRSKKGGGEDGSDEETSSIFVAEPGEWRLLQPVWDLRLGYEEYVASPLFPVLFSVVFYFCCMIPWMVFDLYGREWKWIQKYKIQPNEEVTWPQVRKAIVLTTWNHLLYILPVSIGQWVWTPAESLPTLAPSLWEFCWQQYAALAIFDLEYYIWHSTHHKVRWLYRHIHSVHHQYHAPSSWVTQYLHPWELVSVGIFTTTSPWLFKAHLLTQISFMLLSILVSVEAHIGYDFPLMPHHWAPFWGGVIKHDMHHQKPRTNFQPFFNWWDKIFGTECPGQLAGGVRPKALADWEMEKRELVLKRREEKHRRLALEQKAAQAGKTKAG